MKALWLGLNFIGLGLIVYGALAHYNGADTEGLALVGFVCMGCSFWARRMVFRRK